MTLQRQSALLESRHIHRSERWLSLKCWHHAHHQTDITGQPARQSQILDVLSNVSLYQANTVSCIHCLATWQRLAESNDLLSEQEQFIIMSEEGLVEMNAYSLPLIQCQSTTKYCLNQQVSSVIPMKWYHSECEYTQSRGC